MAVSSRVTSRYAKSLIDLAQEKNLLEIVKTDMCSFIEVYNANSNLVDTLSSPIIDNKTKIAILEKIFKGSVNDLTFAFFKLASSKKRENAIFAIAQRFLTLYNEIKGIKNVSIVSAIPLTASVKAELNNSITKALSKEIILKESIDESLIGGFVLRIDDKQIDNSVKNHLNQIRKKFSQVS